MAVTQIDLDRFAKAKTFAFGDTSATGQAAVTINKGTSATSTVGLDVKNSLNVVGNLIVAGITINTGSFKRTTITGTQNGTNKVFTLSNALAANSDIVIIGGVTLVNDSSADYTISGTTLTFTAGFTAPISTDVIIVYGVY